MSISDIENMQVHVVIPAFTKPYNQNFQMFMGAVADTVKNLCTGEYPGGLAAMGFHLREQAPRVPYALMVECPSQPEHGNANLWAAYSCNAKAYQNVAVTLINLRSKVLVAIGQEIVERLKHPITGLLDVKLVDIFQYLYMHYGQLTARDINDLQAELATPLRNADDFGKMMSRHRQIYSILQATNANVGDFQKMNKVAEVVSAVPLVMQACNQYQIQVQPAARSFHGLVDYIYEALENNTFSVIPVQALGYSGSAQALDVESVLALVVAAVKPKEVKKPGVTQAKSKGDNCYCWVHGYSGHSGESCTIMANPNNSFASECVRAKGPNDIVGKTGSVKNKK